MTCGKPCCTVTLVLCLWSLHAALLRGQNRELSLLSDNLGAQIAASNHKVLAIVQFREPRCEKHPMEMKPDLCAPDFGPFLIARLNILLSRSGKGFKVVTRTQIQEILNERVRKYGENFDNKTLLDIGRLVLADCIVAGEYWTSSDGITVTANILDVGSGMIIGGEMMCLPLTADLDLLRKGGCESGARKGGR